MSSSMVWTREDGQPWVRKNAKKYEVNWTAAADGSVTGVASPFNIYGYVVRVVTDPGSTAPTADYDLTLLDDDSCDVLGGEGSNRSATLIQQVIPALGNSFAPCFVNGTLTPSIANNSQNAATGKIIIYVEE